MGTGDLEPVVHRWVSYQHKQQAVDSTWNEAMERLGYHSPTLATRVGKELYCFAAAAHIVVVASTKHRRGFPIVKMDGLGSC